MIEIVESNPNKPTRVMIFGGAGIGKSSFGAKSDRPIFITPEGGVDQLTDSEDKKIKYFKGINSWDSVREAVNFLLKTPLDFKTVVLDSADWIEKLCHSKIIGTSGKSIITAGTGYGHGYRLSETMHKELIEDLERLREEHGFNIVVTAHSHVKPVKDPSATEDYDRHEIKCHDFVSSLWREYVDALLFARIQTVLSSDGNKRARAMSDGTRVVFTVEEPSFQAKNRYDLPPEMIFVKDKFWNSYMEYAKKGIVEESAESFFKEIEPLRLKIKDEKLSKAIVESMVKAGVDSKKLKPILARLREITGEK